MIRVDKKLIDGLASIENERLLLSLLHFNTVMMFITVYSDRILLLEPEK